MSPHYRYHGIPEALDEFVLAVDQGAINDRAAPALAKQIMLALERDLPDEVERLVTQQGQ